MFIACFGLLIGWNADENWRMNYVQHLMVYFCWCGVDNNDHCNDLYCDLNYVIGCHFEHDFSDLERGGKYAAYLQRQRPDLSW